MRNLTNLVCAAACTVIVGCSTPCRPPVVVRGSTSFDGLLELAKQQASTKPVDIVMANGMRTHKSEWAADSINSMMEVLSSQQRRLEKDSLSKQETIIGLLMLPVGMEIQGLKADSSSDQTNRFTTA